MTHRRAAGWSAIWQTPGCGNQNTRPALRPLPPILPVRGLAWRRRYSSLSAASIGAIYHNGAVVNFSQPYAILRAANVDGTAEVLRLACGGRRKTVHYVSTISVLSGEESGRQLAEDAPLPGPPRRAGGYAQSKWVAERLLDAARGRGVLVRIYRPGTITGDSVSGVCNPDDFLYRFLRGCLAMGSAPEIGDASRPAAGRFHQCRDRAPGGAERGARDLSPGRHATHRHSRYLQLDPVLRYRGRSRAVWRLAPKAGRRGGEISDTHPLAPLAGFFPELPEGEVMRVPPLAVESAMTEAALRKAGVACPAPDERLMHVYLKH